MPPNNSTFKSFKVGYTEDQIRNRAASTAGNCWTVRCLNGAAHKHDDKNPSAFYFPESGYYGCRVCNLKGFADDRDRPDWKGKETRTYSNGSVVHRDWDGSDKRIWQSNAQPTELPFHVETIHDGTKTIYIAEGEKCVEAMLPHLDQRTQAVITSIGGSNAPQKTDWSKIKEAIKRDCKIVFLPDRDEPGEKYIHAVANLLHLEKINVIRLGGDRDDSYDIAEWLEVEVDIATLPEPVDEAVPITTPLRAAGVSDLFDHHTPAVLNWLEKDMIPANKLTMLVGRSGIGKSAMTLYIASAISNGRQPFSEEPSANELFESNQRVVICSTEDDWNDTIVVRLEMMGANMKNIAPLFSQRYGVGRSFDWSGRAGEDEPSDLQMLVEAFKNHPVGLLIIDPLIDVITGANNNDPAVIREAIETKINPILATGCTVIGVHHERKDARRDDLLVDRAIGSQAWTGVARSVLHMQALPKHKAVGTGKNPKPRASLDGKFNIAQRNMDTNSEICGVLVVSKSNLANVDGGWHYELPSSVPAGQTSSFIEVVINQKKITNRTPEELVQIYNPVAQEKTPEAAINTKARRDMAVAISAEKSAESVIQEFFKAEMDEDGRVSASALVDWVMETALVGRNNAKMAIRMQTDKVREGNAFYRVLKKSKLTD